MTAARTTAMTLGSCGLASPARIASARFCFGVEAQAGQRVELTIERVRPGVEFTFDDVQYVRGDPGPESGCVPDLVAGHHRGA